MPGYDPNQPPDESFNPFLGGGWDGAEAPANAAPPSAPPMSGGFDADAPMPPSMGGPISYTGQPFTLDMPTGAPPPMDPMEQARQSAFDRVFGQGDISGGMSDPGMSAPTAPAFSSPAARGNADGSPLSMQDSLGEALRLNREQGQMNVDRAQVGADLSKQKQDFDTNTLIQQDELRAKYQRGIEMAKQVSDQKIEAYKNLKPDTLFGSSRGGERETTIALMILGGINDIVGNRQGQASSAMQALQIGMKQLETDDSIRFGKALNEAKGAQRDLQTLEAQRDVGLAEIAHRNAARWKVVEDNVKSELAQMAPGEARVKAEQNALVIQQKVAQEIERAKMASVDLAEKGMKLALAQRKLRGAGRGGAAVDPDDPDGRYRGLTPYQRFQAEAKDKALEVETIDGQPAGRAKSPKVAQDLVDAKSAAVGLRDSLQEMQRFIKEEGTVQVPGFEASARKRKEGILTGIAGYLTTLNKTGVLSNSEFERYSDIVDPSVFSGNEDAIKPLAELDKFVAGKYARQLQAGLQPGSAAKNPGAVQSPEAPASRAAPGYQPSAGAASSTLAPEDQAAVDWAQSHRSDPRAIKILRLHGM